MRACHELPIPAAGNSCSSLTTDPTAYFANTLAALAVGNVFSHFKEAQATVLTSWRSR
jgi:hypothetical protein